LGEIEAEIGEANERRWPGDMQNRVDAAATILRWLVGLDDRIPVHGENLGELVGGFGDIVRSREQIAEVAAVAAHAQPQAAAMSLDADADPGDREFACQDADYLDGVMVTLAWALGERAEAPITRAQPRELTARALESERGYADDVIEQGGNQWAADWLPPRWYGEGVKSTITWLLGDSTGPPVDPSGNRPSAP
jgi:hypothetical protein